MKKFFIAVMLTLVSACTAFPTQTQQVQAACASVTASIYTLTLYVDRLTTEQSTAVNDSLEAIYPVCGTGAEPDYDSVKLAALEAVQAELTKLITEVK